MPKSKPIHPQTNNFCLSKQFNSPYKQNEQSKTIRARLQFFSNKITSSFVFCLGRVSFVPGRIFLCFNSLGSNNCCRNINNNNCLKKRGQAFAVAGAAFCRSRVPSCFNSFFIFFNSDSLHRKRPGIIFRSCHKTKSKPPIGIFNADQRRIFQTS